MWPIQIPRSQKLLTSQIIRRLICAQMDRFYYKNSNSKQAKINGVKFNLIKLIKQNDEEKFRVVGSP